MKTLKHISVLLLALSFAHSSFSTETANPPKKNKKTTYFKSACTTAQAQTDLNINNVRARLLTGGDMWWNRSEGAYIVPKPAPGQPEVSAIFAAGNWMGGLDLGNNLKTACQTYGNAGGNSDFWPGPIADDGTTNEATCNLWDRHFEVKLTDIHTHFTKWQQSQNGQAPYPASEIPVNVKGWPGKGNPYFSEVHGFNLPNTIGSLAEFYDQNSDGIYNPLDGDSPSVGLSNCDIGEIFPDQMIFWVFNDEGSGAVHGETKGYSIGMEVRSTAFAFTSADQINDMTFYRQKFVNHAVNDIDSFFFALWVDPDLGCYMDDYIGCDPSRNLAYYYNADAMDGEPGASCNGYTTYGNTVPALGIDILRGPSNELGNEMPMSSFIYYRNLGISELPAGNIDPSQDIAYYNYLNGCFADGTPLTAGGYGYDPSSIDFTPFAFPNEPNDPSGWSICHPGPNFPSGLPSQWEYRTVQSFGPMLLKPGSLNQMLYGVIYAPDMPYPCPDMSKLFYASDLAQCFITGCIGDLTRASDAPDMDFLELDREIIGLLSNEPPGGNSNNSSEDYNYVKSCDFGIGDNRYRFEGYLVYQLAGPDARLDSLEFPEHARLVFQTDKKNGVSKVYNWKLTTTPDGDFYQPELKVEGNDQGLQHSFKLTNDAFAEGDDKRLINHKTYCFTVLAYDYNQFLPFDPSTLMGQKTEYMQSHQNVKVYCATPRPILDQTLNAAYGEDLAITRIEGVGVGGNFMDMDDASLQRILDGSFAGEIGYLPGRGPITAKVYNPFDLVDGEYEISFVDDDLNNAELDSDVRWTLQKLNSSEAPIRSDHTIDVLNEQLFAQYGFAISIGQTKEAGECGTLNAGAIGSESVYADVNGPQWFGAIPDEFDLGLLAPFNNLFNFVPTFFSANCDYAPLAQLGTRHFVPYQLCDWNTFVISPAWNNALNELVINKEEHLRQLNNVDIVFTPDKSLWSRCVVVETMTQDYANYGIAEQGSNVMAVGNTAEYTIQSFDLRGSPSVGKDDANDDGLPDPDGDGDGMGWFPGYAIDVETGKRLNIFFGENSAFSNQNGYLNKYPGGRPNGGDMLFNPNSLLLLGGTANNNMMRYYAGGQHFVYVTNEVYDSCQYLRSRFGPHESDVKKVNGLKDVTWASMILLEPGKYLLPLSQGLIPNEYRVKLRVDNPYEVAVGTGEKNGYPTYRFKVEGMNAVPHETPALKSALSQINVVPNPFYFPHGYAGEAGTGVVKFINLPAKCTVTVYTLDGKLVRIFERNEQPGQPNGSAIEETQIAPDLEWDVTSGNGKQLATGVYLIHIKAPGIGERTLKLVVV